MGGRREGGGPVTMDFNSYRDTTVVKDNGYMTRSSELFFFGGVNFKKFIYFACIFISSEEPSVAAFLYFLLPKSKGT